MSVVEAARDPRGVLTVTLADEANRNALSTRLVGELSDALDAADADPDVRVVVLTNRGRVFWAGADLSERASDDARAAAPSRPLRRRGHGPRRRHGSLHRRR